MPPGLDHRFKIEPSRKYWTGTGGNPGPFIGCVAMVAVDEDGRWTNLNDRYGVEYAAIGENTGESSFRCRSLSAPGLEEILDAFDRRKGQPIGPLRRGGQRRTASKVRQQAGHF